MDISLTPQELRDLLTPPLLRLRVRPELNLDAMTATSDLADAAADEQGLSAQRALFVTLADLAQAKEELARTKVLVEEKAEELRQLIENYGKVRQTPIMQANEVIENAGTQAHDLARIFFLESGSSAWYEGVRATLKNLLDTLGVEVDEQLEEHLRPAEATLEEQPPAPESHLDLGPGELGAADAVPPAGQMRTKCKTCGEELRSYPEGWIDAETHATGEDGHTHDPDLSDVRCEHGLAADMHCCECRRSGFFPPDSCNCYTTGVDVGDGDAVAAAIETDHRVIAQVEADAGRGTVAGEAEIKDEIEF